MIDINKLRRLAEEQQWIGRWYDAGCETLMAERNGEHEEVAHLTPIGLVPYLVAVQPATISELLGRLEEAESDALEQARLNGMGSEREAALMAKLAEAERERDALRAKITEMEKQAPFDADSDVFRSAFEAALKAGNWPATRQGDGYRSPSTQIAWRIAFSTVNRLKLYLAPGAQPAPSIPEAVMEVIAGLVYEVERNICPHEETHRGGQWEICDMCGAKWADDRGGKPEFKWPEVVEKARAMLASAPEAKP